MLLLLPWALVVALPLMFGQLPLESLSGPPMLVVAWLVLLLVAPPWGTPPWETMLWETLLLWET